MTSMLLGPNRPAAYRGFDFSDAAPWRKDRVSFPHCLPCVTKAARDLAAFPAGWDGYGAKAVEPSIIRAACRLLSEVAERHGELLLKPGTETECLLPHCVPTVGGGVQLEWHVADRILELEFTTPDAIRYLKWWPGHAVADEEADYPADDLWQSAALIRWVLYGDDAPAG